MTTERRLLFGSVAQHYDRFRPSYPQELITDVIAYAGGRASELRVLDVGAGTGIATRQFAPLVRELTALEPDPEMAAVAREHPATSVNVTYVESDFEHAELEPESFDLLISATAWHWVDPEVRYRRAVEVLRPGGAVAAFWHHPEWGRSPLRAELDRAYREEGAYLDEHNFSVMHPGNPQSRLRLGADSWEEQLGGAEGLEDLQVRDCRWAREYTASQYIGLLGTHSDHLMLPADRRRRLLDAIAAVIDGPGGGLLRVPYLTTLSLARRV